MVMNMTMTYDGTMVMPKNYAVVTEDEMTYVDGGYYRTATHYFSSAADAYKKLNDTALWLYGASVVQGVGWAICGALLGLGIGGGIGAAIGAGIGAVGGIIAGCVLWGAASACDNGAIQAKKLGTRSCRVTVTQQNLTFNISVA